MNPLCSKTPLAGESALPAVAVLTQLALGRNPRAFLRCIKRPMFAVAVFVVQNLVSAENGNAALQCGPYLNGIQTCDAGINSTLDHVTALSDQQSQSEWCWAACISMIFNYYGHSVSQEKIVAGAWGKIVNLPGTPAQIVASLNRNWIDDDGTTFRAFGDVFTANAMTAAQDLAGDHPLIVGSMGHAMVLVHERYYRNVYGQGQVVLASVSDPWPGNGVRDLTPQEWYSVGFVIRIRIQ